MQENYLYFKGTSLGGLRRMNTDGKHKKMITIIDAPQHINVVGNWIYYRTSKVTVEGAYLYKVNINGKHRQKILDDKVGAFIVMDDQIYFKNISDHGRLYKVHVDGNHLNLLDSGNAEDINIIDDWIYYKNVSKNDEIYKIKTDGSEKTALGIKISLYSSLYLYEDEIYFTDLSDDGGALYRTDLTGNHKEKIYTGEISYICFSDEWAYFLKKNAEGGNDLIKYNLIKHVEENLLTDITVNGLGINIVGDWVYYISRKDDDIHRIKNDGSIKERF